MQAEQTLFRTAPRPAPPVRIEWTWKIYFGVGDAPQKVVRNNGT